MAELLQQENVQTLIDERGQGRRLREAGGGLGAHAPGRSLEQMSEVRGEAQFEDFLRQQDRDRVIKDKDLQDLKRTFAEANEDHASSAPMCCASWPCSARWSLTVRSLWERSTS